MFDLGIQELIVIFVVALLVFGPKRLPELARTMGKGFGQLRRAMFDIKAEVEREMEEETGQIKHDVPDWKQEYPINRAPAEGETEDIKGLNREGYEVQKPDSENDAKPGTDHDSSSKETFTPASPEQPDPEQSKES